MRDGPTIATVATFHSGKNIVSESRTRVRRRAAAAFAVGAFTFSVGACGNVPQEDHDPGRAGKVASATPAPPEFDTTFAEVKPTVSRSAIDKFGLRGRRSWG